jgi:two-component system sensor histidine kinase/response regulator
LSDARTHPQRNRNDAPPAWVAALATAGLDTESGLRRTAGNSAIYLTLLRMFVAGHRDEAADIRRALETSDWKTAERRAHTIKGLAGMIGADALQSLAVDVEVAIKERRSDALDDRLQAFARELAALIDALQAGLPAEAPVAAADGMADPARVAVICRELDGYLARDDLQARSHLESHFVLLSHAFPQDASPLRAAVSSFDYVGARAVLARACESRSIPLPGAAPRD